MEGAVFPSTQVSVLRGAIGSLQEYRIGTDWNIYQERLEQYFLANYVENDRMVPVLLTIIGDKAYEILKGLCDPVLPKNKTFDELCILLQKQFTKKVSVFKERIEFYSLRQAEKESVADFYVRIKNKAIDCKFGTTLNNVLKDKFVCGVRKGPVLDRLCEEDHTTTLEHLYELALRKEAAAVEANTLVPVNKISSTSVNQGRNREAREGGSGGLYGESKCNACGGIKHDFRNCKYRKYSCKICRKVGHLAKMCNKNKGKSTHYVEPVESENSDSENVQDFDFVNMYHTSFDNVNNGFIKPQKANMLINDCTILMELDSGAGISVLPENIYIRYFKTSALLPTKVRLRSFDGSIITPLGEIFVTIQYNNVRVDNCRLIIIKNGTTALIGRDLMKTFNFEIKLPGVPNININKIDQDAEIARLVKKYSSLFSNELGHYRFEKVDLKMEPNAKPIFCKPRPLPFAFKRDVNAELDELESKGVITLIENAEWGTPLVPIVKETGKIRVCAHYKITVNKFLIDVKHPLPRVEELFAALQGGHLFTKLDFKNAYNQLELTEETKKLLSWSTHRGIYQV
ncbi:uncharacterized protein K02A2.6-like, partial [Diabrotica virgifera virgifera]|uniref:Reverse transcriptase domain-containing protein n=1 Tax=Diabrotica virgifera virgifera TaxID=50390 RepID=A0ABM5KB66_DIAVI